MSNVTDATQTQGRRWFGDNLRDMDRPECLRLLQQAKVGRLAFVDEHGPDLVPVNYTLDGEDLLIATSGHGVLARAATTERVAFEVDRIDEATRTGWSVVVRGRISRDSPFEAPESRPEPWAGGIRTFLIRVTADVVTGRQVLAP